MKSLEMISVERSRQIEEEGWDEAHDDRHTEGELTKAAICYAASALGVEVREVGTSTKFTVGSLWPWSEDWDKRDKHDEIRSLTIAGALIAAEIDRLLRSRKGEGPLQLRDLSPGDLFADEDGDVYLKTAQGGEGIVVCVSLDDGKDECIASEETVTKVHKPS